MQPLADPSPEATAPRVTPDDIEAEIASEHYFTGHDAAMGQHQTEGGVIAIMHPNSHDNAVHAGDALRLLTFCVLVLRNGFTVTGASACASPENFNAETGRQIARKKAAEQLWPLLGFRLRDKIAGEGRAP